MISIYSHYCLVYELALICIPVVSSINPEYLLVFIKTLLKLLISGTLITVMQYKAVTYTVTSVQTTLSNKAVIFFVLSTVKDYF